MTSKIRKGLVNNQFKECDLKRQWHILGFYPRKYRGLRKYPKLSPDNVKDAEHHSTAMFVVKTLIALRYSKYVPVNAIKAHEAMET